MVSQAAVSRTIPYNQGISLILTTSLSVFYIAATIDDARREETSMSLLDQLSDPVVWEKFYAYKTSLACPKDIERQLRGFLDAKKYLPVSESILRTAASPKEYPFPLPRRAVISKQSSQKKRVVYTYPPEENVALKLLTYLLLRKYDNLFCDVLFSFRPGKSAREAIHYLRQIPDLHKKFSYKVDVSNYFNSIPIERLLPDLESVTKDDPALFSFLRALLTEPLVLTSDFEGKLQPVAEQKGIMAGTPLASFYANLYLRDMDRWFYDQGIPYARYSDDVILFGDTREEVLALAEKLRAFLSEKGLTVNPSKEELRSPEEGFVFLGFFLKDGRIDVAPASLTKMKQKMRRKTRALQRWKNRNGLPGEKAAKAFARIFHRKLLESSTDSDLTWSYWYFSTINTTESLHAIDLYAQECLRYLITGTHGKSRFNARYRDLKSLGYKTLVNAYYAFPERTNSK